MSPIVFLSFLQNNATKKEIEDCLIKTTRLKQSVLQKCILIIIILKTHSIATKADC